MPPADIAPARWLRTGREGYERMLAAIARAQLSLRLETYIYRARGPGERFRAALTAAAARGVRVQVLLDAFGSSELPAGYWSELEQAGGVVHCFNPLSLRLFTVRNHRKLLLVDDLVAFVGGFNIAAEYDGDGVATGWRDLGLELRLPAAVPRLAEAFDAMFRHHLLHRRLLQHLRPTPPGLRRGGVERNPVLLSGPFLARNEFRRALLHALRHAKHVRLISAYFAPSLRLRRALRRVARRGGSVELLLAGKTDVPLAQTAGRSFYSSLLRAGVRIWEYRPQVLHAKLAIVDGVVFAGSANLDARSLGINYELMVGVADPPLVAEAHELFTADLGHSEEVMPPAWARCQNWRTRLAGYCARFLVTKMDPWIARRQLRALS